MSTGSKEKQFNVLSAAINTKFHDMESHHDGTLFVVDISSDDIWNHYLESFPPGTNELFVERREYDCQCCKQFIRKVGKLVSIVGNELQSVWDIDIPEEPVFQIIADSMSKFIKSHNIVSTFVDYQKTIGARTTLSNSTSGVVEYEHFYCNDIKNVTPKDKCNAVRGKFNSSVHVFNRALLEIESSSVEMVLELIDENNLYRGDQYKSQLEQFLIVQKEFNSVETSNNPSNFVWACCAEHPELAHIRNSAIGTLLVNLSENMELEVALKKFEDITAPTNYKRPKAVVTKSMVESAKKEVQKLGIGDSLQRRHSKLSDITINDVIYADKSIVPEMDVFDEIAESVSGVNLKSLSNVSEISLNEFITNIVPISTNIQVLVENKHKSNLVSLISPDVSDSPNILKWKNNFSWTYIGDATDSIKERVKTAGGTVDAILRTSLGWSNSDDLDLSVIEPDKNTIYYGDRVNHMTTGNLDVDMNAGSHNNAIDPVENIVWTDSSKMKSGKYSVMVTQYTQRNTSTDGFEVELEFDGKVYTYFSDKFMKSGENVKIVDFEYSSNGLKIIKEYLTERSSPSNIWGINTQNFVRVNAIMNSPNYWETSGNVGTQHVFFMLEACKNPENIRGLYNEFINNELITKHKRMFEVLGNKLKVQYSEDQLSGIGFSLTKRTSFIVKVTSDNGTKTIKVKI